MPENKVAVIVYLKSSQLDWLEGKGVNRSKLIRKLISRLMKSRNDSIINEIAD